jgi:hypothetical protein
MGQVVELAVICKNNSEADKIKSEPVNPNDLPIDPNNKNWTSPRSWGVLKTTPSTNRSNYHQGNYPIRGLKSNGTKTYAND